MQHKMEHDMEIGILQAFMGMGVSQNQGYFLRVSIIKTIVFWGQYTGAPLCGNHPVY